MFIMPVEEQLRQTARQEFVQLNRHSHLTRVLSPMLGRQHRLLRLDEVRCDSRLRSRSDVGIQTVSIDSIHGSESRSADFDRQWRPLTDVNRERWTNIAVAQMNDVALPAIDLIKIGESYFVRDGHHRVSVAKHHGQLEIEAIVTEWHLAGDTSAKPMSMHGARAYAQQRPFGQVVQTLSTGITRLSTVAGTMQREFSLRTATLLNRRPKPYNSGTTA